MKSEPEEFSIFDLERLNTTLWTGVRNYQARNFMKDKMKIGDQVLFYHSNATPPGVAGLAKVTGTGLVDPLQFDKSSDYYDQKSTPDNPRWVCAEISFVFRFKHFVSLPEIRSTQGLENLLLVKKGQRLSIQPVNTMDFNLIVALGQN